MPKPINPSTQRSRILREKRREAGLVEITIGMIGGEKGLRKAVPQELAKEVKRLINDRLDNA